MHTYYLQNHNASTCKSILWIFAFSLADIHIVLNNDKSETNMSRFKSSSNFYFHVVVFHKAMLCLYRFYDLHVVSLTIDHMGVQFLKINK